ncbi:hypothetical protein J6590_018283 [Homalodisca vitripennis]|nr:hypothetical protein J6590_018283 [Homalodisca vitripennis]
MLRTKDEVKDPPSLDHASRLEPSDSDIPQITSPSPHTPNWRYQPVPTTLPRLFRLTIAFHHYRPRAQGLMTSPRHILASFTQFHDSLSTSTLILNLLN